MERHELLGPELSPQQATIEYNATLAKSLSVIEASSVDLTWQLTPHDMTAGMVVEGPELSGNPKVVLTGLIDGLKATAVGQFDIGNRQADKVWEYQLPSGDTGYLVQRDTRMDTQQEPVARKQFELFASKELHPKVIEALQSRQESSNGSHSSRTRIINPNRNKLSPLVDPKDALALATRGMARNVRHYN